jgi:hypothetical protein
MVVRKPHPRLTAAILRWSRLTRVSRLSAVAAAVQERMATPVVQVVAQGRLSGPVAARLVKVTLAAAVTVTMQTAQDGAVVAVQGLLVVLAT